MNRSQLNTNLPDNNSGAILPSNIRDVVDAAVLLNDTNTGDITLTGQLQAGQGWSFDGAGTNNLTDITFSPHVQLNHFYFYYSGTPGYYYCSNNPSFSLVYQTGGTYSGHWVVSNSVGYTAEGPTSSTDPTGTYTAISGTGTGSSILVFGTPTVKIDNQGGMTLQGKSSTCVTTQLIAGSIYSGSNLEFQVVDGSLSSNSTIANPGMPTSDPTDGTNTLWYDPATNIVYRGT